MIGRLARRQGSRRLSLLALVVLAGGASLWWAPAFEAAAQNGGSLARHRMTRITDTIYRADAPGTPGINSTSWVFVNETDVLVTDSEGSPASARSLLEGIKTITNKPVKYLVDTHFHLDHAYGNAALPADVQIIGHDFTRKALLGREAREGTTIKWFTTPMPDRIAGLKKQAAAEADPAKKTTLEAQAAAAEATLAVYSGDFPLQAPNVTVARTMSVWSGTKEFRIFWPGRAHTAGDLVVYVPSERAAATGDIVFKATVGWQGDAFPNEQAETLETLRPLNLDLLLPGHGEHVQGTAAIAQAISSMQAYVRDEFTQVAAAKKAGLSPDAALKQLSLSKHAPVYGQSVTPTLPAVQRIYDIIDGKAELN